MILRILELLKVLVRVLLKDRDLRDRNLYQRRQKRGVEEENWVQKVKAVKKVSNSCWGVSGSPCGTSGEGSWVIHMPSLLSPLLSALSLEGITSHTSGLQPWKKSNRQCHAGGGSQAEGVGAREHTGHAQTVYTSTPSDVPTLFFSNWFQSKGKTLWRTILLNWYFLGVMLCKK